MPTPRRSLTRAALRAEMARVCLAPRPVDQVGAEMELTPAAWVEGRFSVEETRRRSELLMADLGGNRLGAGAITREPGGQIEYSGPPCPTPDAATRDLHRAASTLRRLGRRHDLTLLAVGFHPWATCDELGLRTQAPRYVSMQTYFDRIGPAGRDMMRRTGSVQVCLDPGADPAEVAERWELAQRLAPILAATFALSRRSAESSHDGWASLRARTWLDIDPRRTGIPPRFLDDPTSDPVDQYIDFALRAPLMFVVASDGVYHVPDPEFTFDSWLDDGLDDIGFPDLEDWDRHLSTLFPEVRARGYVELRSCDAPGMAWLGVPILVASTALHEAAARRSLLASLRPEHDRLEVWRQRAARLALADPDLAEAARALFAAVRPYLKGRRARQLVEVYEERFVKVGRTPGDECGDEEFVSPGHTVFG